MLPLPLSPLVNRVNALGRGGSGVYEANGTAYGGFFLRIRELDLYEKLKRIDGKILFPDINLDKSNPMAYC
jgi:hypothetical protein